MEAQNGGEDVESLRRKWLRLLQETEQDPQLREKLSDPKWLGQVTTTNLKTLIADAERQRKMAADFVRDFGNKGVGPSSSDKK